MHTFNSFKVIARVAVRINGISVFLLAEGLVKFAEFLIENGLTGFFESDLCVDIGFLALKSNEVLARCFFGHVGFFKLNGFFSHFLTPCAGRKYRNKKHGKEQDE